MTASRLTLACALPLAAALAASSANAHPGEPHAGPVAPALSAEAGAAAQAVDAFHAALGRGDAAAAAALLDDDALVFEEGEAEQSKSAYAAGHLAADIAYLKAVRETTADRNGAATGDLAWIATRGRALGRFHDKAVDRATTETIVLRRTPQGWRIVHIHWSSHASKPPAD